MRTRSLPVHSAIRDEILAYRDQVVAEHGAGPLFPMIAPDRDGRRNTTASAQIMTWMRAPEPVGPALANTDRTLLDSYCWRRTMRSQLSANKVDGDRARWMLGHAAKDIDAAHYLEHYLPQLIEAIEGLPGLPSGE